MAGEIRLDPATGRAVRYRFAGPLHEHYDMLNHDGWSETSYEEGE